VNQDLGLVALTAGMVAKQFLSPYVLSGTDGQRVTITTFEKETECVQGGKRPIVFSTTLYGTVSNKKREQLANLVSNILCR